MEMSSTTHLQKDESTTEQEGNSPQTLFEEDPGADPRDRPEPELIHVQYTLRRLLARTAQRSTAFSCHSRQHALTSSRSLLEAVESDKCRAESQGVQETSG